MPRGWRSTKFAKLDKSTGLLGHGILRFDLRMPGKMIVRLPHAPANRSPARAAAGGLVRRMAARPTPRLLRSTSARRRSARLIASRGEDGALTVLGTGQRESRGVKRGYITDMAASEFAVREAVELAERMSG